VRLGPSTPGDYVRARVLVPRNPSVTHGEREVEEGEGGCCAGNPNEREREKGGAWGGVGARGTQGRAGLGWVGLGRATSRIETHDVHDH
jgi:hypothetical protein